MALELPVTFVPPLNTALLPPQPPPTRALSSPSSQSSSKVAFGASPSPRVPQTRHFGCRLPPNRALPSPRQQHRSSGAGGSGDPPLQGGGCHRCLPALCPHITSLWVWCRASGHPLHIPPPAGGIKPSSSPSWAPTTYSRTPRATTFGHHMPVPAFPTSFNTPSYPSRHPQILLVGHLPKGLEGHATLGQGHQRLPACSQPWGLTQPVRPFLPLRQ